MEIQEFLQEKSWETYPKYQMNNFNGLIKREGRSDTSPNQKGGLTIPQYIDHMYQQGKLTYSKYQETKTALANSKYYQEKEQAQWDKWILMANPHY